jgi:hypothetical protein
MNRHSTMNSAGLRWGSPAAIPNWCFLAWTNIESQMEKPQSVTFWSDDVQATWRVLQSKGVEFAMEPKTEA